MYGALVGSLYVFALTVTDDSYTAYYFMAEFLQESAWVLGEHSITSFVPFSGFTGYIIKMIEVGVNYSDIELANISLLKWVEDFLVTIFIAFIAVFIQRVANVFLRLITRNNLLLFGSRLCIIFSSTFLGLAFMHWIRLFMSNAGIENWFMVILAGMIVAVAVICYFTINSDNKTAKKTILWIHYLAKPTLKQFLTWMAITVFVYFGGSGNTEVTVGIAIVWIICMGILDKQTVWS